jgi:hypothetical protein
MMEEGSPEGSLQKPNGVGTTGPWFITLSEKACDFRYAIIDNPDSFIRQISSDPVYCGGSSIFPGVSYGIVDKVENYAGKPYPVPYNCLLDNGKTYYINIRREQAYVPAARGKVVSERPEYSAPLIQLKPGLRFN